MAPEKGVAVAILKQTDRPLNDIEILDWLTELRGKPFVAGSGFDVTAVFRVKVGDNKNIYVAGVNVENPDHRLSTHAEEGCIAAMTTAFGKHAEIIEGWVMGAPRNLKPGDKDALADNCVTCCGKCRQQIAGLAAPEVKIHGFSLNGEMKTTTVGEMLPDAFTFRQFAPEVLEARAPKGPTPTVEQAKERLVRTGKDLSQEEIIAWLKDLEPIDYASGHSQSVIVRLTNGAYVAGVRVEEAAYLSTDAVQSAAANAHALFGDKEHIAEVWVYGKNDKSAQAGEDMFVPLNLSGVQVATQFEAYNAIPVNMVNDHGVKEIKLQDAARYTPTFDEPMVKIGPERLINKR